MSVKVICVSHTATWRVYHNKAVYSATHTKLELLHCYTISSLTGGVINNNNILGWAKAKKIYRVTVI